MIARNGDVEGVIDSAWTGVKCKVWLPVSCEGGQSVGRGASKGPGAYGVGQPIKQPQDANQGEEVFSAQQPIRVTEARKHYTRPVGHSQRGTQCAPSRVPVWSLCPMS